MAELLSSDEEAVLKRTAMFSALDDSALEEFLAGCRVLRRASGSQIFRPTDRAALEASGRTDIPVHDVTVRIDGTIIEQTDQTSKGEAR